MFRPSCFFQANVKSALEPTNIDFNFVYASCFLFYFETFSSMWNIRRGGCFCFLPVSVVVEWRFYLSYISYQKFLFFVFMCVIHKYSPCKNVSEICWPPQKGVPMFLPFGIRNKKWDQYKFWKRICELLKWWLYFVNIHVLWWNWWL